MPREGAFDEDHVTWRINTLLKELAENHCEAMILVHVYDRITQDENGQDVIKEDATPASGVLGIVGPWPLESKLMALKKVIDRLDLDPVHAGTMLLAMGAHKKIDTERLESLLENNEE